MKRYKRIGVLGGMSPESTAQFYSLLAHKHYEKYHDYAYPEIVIFSVDFAHIVQLQEEGNRSKYASVLAEGVKSLERAGAELIVIASNTPHMVFDLLKAETKVQILGIPECVANRAKELGLDKLLLLGTKYTMQSKFYHEAFAGSRIDVIVPSEGEQTEVNRIIYGELVVGDFNTGSKRKLLSIIGKYPVDAVILGCTELSLAIKPNDTPLVLLDTIDIYADAMWDAAVR